MTHIVAAIHSDTTAVRYLTALQFKYGLKVRLLNHDEFPPTGAILFRTEDEWHFAAKVLHVVTEDDQRNGSIAVPEHLSGATTIVALRKRPNAETGTLEESVESAFSYLFGKTLKKRHAERPAWHAVG